MIIFIRPLKKNNQTLTNNQKKNHFFQIINKNEFILFTLTSRRDAGFNVWMRFFSFFTLKTGSAADAEQQVADGGVGATPTGLRVQQQVTQDSQASTTVFLDKHIIFALFCFAITFSDVHFFNHLNYLNHIDIEISVNCAHDLKVL